jgi:hypothetical protein
MREWSLGKFVMIDEMMVRYKGSYCPIWQYMPKKPKKWGIKFWVLADSIFKFIYCFDIYCGKNLEAEVRVPSPSVQAGVAYAVVMNLLQGLEYKDHRVVMDNFFCSIPLFKDLEAKGIYATSTIRSNRIGLLSHLKNTRAWQRREGGHIEWTMHESRDISCVMWKDKCPVLLISTHAIPIGFPCMPVDTVPRKHGAVRDDVQTSPIFVEYTTFMRGVDIANQLRASYSSQTRNHKWWHRVFIAMLDVTKVNMYIMYLSWCKEGPNPIRHPMNHLQFKVAFCEALLQGWPLRNNISNEALTDQPTIHMPSHTSLKRACVVCEVCFVTNADSNLCVRRKAVINDFMRLLCDVVRLSLLIM